MRRSRVGSHTNIGRGLTSPRPMTVDASAAAPAYDIIQPFVDAQFSSVRHVFVFFISVLLGCTGGNRCRRVISVECLGRDLERPRHSNPFFMAGDHLLQSGAAFINRARSVQGATTRHSLLLS